MRERGQEYRTDATNFETVYTRNRIRHEILPILQEINPSAISHMVRTADVLRETCEYLDMQAGALAEQAVVYEENEAMIQGEKLREVPALAAKSGAVSGACRLSGNRKDISEVHVAELRKLFGRQVGKHICLPYGLYAVRDYEGVRIGTRRDLRKKKGNGGKPAFWKRRVFRPHQLKKKQNPRFPKKKYTKCMIMIR